MPLSETLSNIGIAAAAVAVLVAAGIWLLNPLFRLLAKAGAREVMTAAALLVVLGAAVMMEMAHLSMAMGAFIAGVLLSESSFRHQLEADIEPFRGLLLGLFFLAVGLSLNLNVVAEDWQIIVAGVVALMLVKGVCIYVVARLMKSKHDEAIDRAILMAQGGEFAFVLYQVASQQGVFDDKINANMTAIIVLSMVLTPLVVLLHKRLMKPQAVSMDGVEEAHDLHGQALVIGFGRFGQIVSQALLAHGSQISIIDNDTDTIRAAGRYGFKIYYGDGAREDILHAAGAHHAKVIAVCIDDKDAATRIVEITRRTCPQTRVLVRAYDREHALELVKQDADWLIRETFESALQMGREAVSSVGADDNQADDVIDELRRRDAERFTLEVAGGPFAGRALVLGNIDYIEPPKHDDEPESKPN